MKRASSKPRASRFLNLLSLRRGDLILTGDTDRESRMIARQTDGPFSHVAIVRSFAQRFEALGDGVGLTNHKVDRLERRAGRLCALMQITEAHCLVLRHRASREEDEEAQQAFARAVFRFIGVRYSSLDRLLLALPESHPLRPLGGPIIRRLSSIRRKLIHRRLRPPGLFCSEVVLEVFAEMGWELPGMSPAEVSPNDLYRLGMTTGPLAPVGGSVVEPDHASELKAPEEDAQASDLMEALRDLPPGRFMVDELIKEKDSLYAKRAIARHLADVLRLALGKAATLRKRRHPERVTRLLRVLEELEAFEEKASGMDAAAGLNRKEAPPRKLKA